MAGAVLLQLALVQRSYSEKQQHLLTTALLNQVVVFLPHNSAYYMLQSYIPVCVLDPGEVVESLNS